MGGFYAKQIERLGKEPDRFYTRLINERDLEYERKVVQNHEQYRQQLRQVRQQVYALAVEMLRYQAWAS